MEKQKRIWYLGMVMLSFATLTLIFRQLSETFGHLVIQHYLVLVVFAFVGMAAVKCTRIRADYWMGVAYAVWYVIASIIRNDLYMKQGFLPFCLICLFSLMAFPFAFVMDDGRRKTGLKLFGSIFFISVTLFAILALWGALRGEMVRHWLYEKAYFGIGSEKRLEATNHANISAALLLSALMLGCWLMNAWKKRWMILPWILMSLCLYFALALAVSRTTMLQFSFFIAAAAAFLMLRLPWKRTWLKWLAFAAVGAVTAVVVFSSFELAIDLFNTLRGQMPSAAAEEVAYRPFYSWDIKNFTGRTSIYQAVIQVITSSRRSLLAGLAADNWGNLIQGISGFHYFHAHNAFLQAAVMAGLPAALMALWFAIRTVSVSMKVLFVYEKHSSYGDKLLCLMLLALLVSTITEVYLFTDIQPWFSFLYFLILGYVLESSRSLKRTKE